MKLFTLRHTILLLALLVLLTYLFILGRAISVESHQAILESAHELSEYEAILNKNILLVRYGVDKHYDLVNNNLKRIRMYKSQLQNSIERINIKGSENIKNKLQSLDEIIDNKEDAIETFKSRNAILNNSVMYFSLASKRLAKKISKGKVSLLTTKKLTMLSMEMVHYIRNPTVAQQSRIDQLIEELKDSELEGVYQVEHKQLIQHGKIISRMTKKVDDNTANATRIGLALVVYESLDQYLALYNKSEANAKRYRWLSYIVSILLLIYIINIFRKLKSSATELALSNMALSNEKARIQTTMDSLGDGVIKTNKDGIVEHLNPVAEVITGWKSYEAVGKSITDMVKLIEKDTGSEIVNPIQQCISTRKRISPLSELILSGKNKSEFIVKVNVAPVMNDNAEAEGSVMVIHDLSETLKLIEHISHQEKHDALTGLSNRTEFENHLRNAVEQAYQTSCSHMLCYIDLDQFKIINDTCGHVAGDELLRQIGFTLEKNVRDTDKIARLGGDEFGILLWNCPVTEIEMVVGNLLNAVKKHRFTWQDKSFEISASIGVVIINKNTRDISQVMLQADLACYTAKDLGRHRFHIYQKEDEELERRHKELHWAASITEALDKGRFNLYCQRIEQIKPDELGAIVKYEILLRLVGEDGIGIMPGAFIPAAERYNLMGAIDRWVISTALSNLFILQSEYNYKNYQFCINLSGNSLSDPTLLEFIRSELQKYPMERNSLCFEITETAAISNLNEALNLISVLREQGVLFALDDFGSGLSSFSYLKNLPVDYLKIDGSFVRNILTNPTDKAMVEAINYVGHAMGMKTIAEFVENNEILSQLDSLSVDYAQGYGIAMPIPLTELFTEGNQAVNQK